MKVAIIFVVLLLVSFAVYYMYVRTPADESLLVSPKMQNSNMKLTSSAFENTAPIPQKFTCEGLNVNPELQISDVPDGAKSSVLIIDDPDAIGGITWDHWVMWNIDPKTSVIAENSVPAGVIQGMTSFGDQKYGGPCPPRGSKPHRYMFKLYALDTELDLPASSRKSDIERAMAGHVLAETKLLGMFNR